MKHKSDSDDIVLAGDTVLGEDSTDAEFDDAVTSEIKIIDVAPLTFGEAVEAGMEDTSAGTEQQAGDGPAEVDEEVLEPGVILNDRFEIVAMVHSGGMGHVYKAVDRRHHDGSHVAIKMVRPSVAARVDANQVLEREAAKTRLLAHPNIVNVFDFDQHGEHFYIVMEWLEGESLTDLLRRTSGQQLEPRFAWGIVEGIAAGLQHAHAHNVVHADINPSNVFITETREIKLLDFGIARYATDAANSDEPGMIWATRTYASPEALSGSPPGFEDDIFSFACVAYRLITGAHPFSGLPSIDARDAGAEIPPAAGLSEEHWQTLRRALSFDPSERPNSAGDLVAAPVVQSESRAAFTLFGRSLPDWWPAVPVAASIIFAGLWLFSQSPVDSTAPAAAGPSILETDAATTSPELEALLSRAASAFEEARLVAPAGESARDFYRQVLTGDPSNKQALDGLRAISDIYLEQATAAASGGEIAAATEALNIATDVSPDNPGIAIVKALVLAQGDRVLARAELAAAAGDTDRALEMLAEAELYGNVDAGAIAAARNRIVQSVEERQFLSTLATADEHLSAGRLLTPAGSSAHEILLDLKEQWGENARLIDSMERLGERLLTRAAFATAAGSFGEASRILRATEALGVLEQDVAAGQRSLQLARATAAEAEAARTAAAAASIAEVPAEPSGDAEVSAVGERAQQPMAAVAAPAGPVTAEATETAAPTSMPDAPVESSVIIAGGAATEPAQEPTAAIATTPANLADSGAATPGNAGVVPAALPGANAASGAGSSNTDEENLDEARPLPQITLADLAIENYVAPAFPRVARRRDLEGFVELRFNVNPDGSTGAIETISAEPGSVFVASAKRAVSQWRFAPRDEVFTTRVKLSFSLEP